MTRHFGFFLHMFTLKNTIFVPKPHHSKDGDTT